MANRKDHRRTGRATLVLSVLLIGLLIQTDAGTPGAEATSPTCTVSPGGVVYAEQCPGTDAGAKIAAAVTVLGSTSGTIDARGIHSNLSITQPITLGIEWVSSHHLLLGPGFWTTSHPIVVQMESSIVGTPMGNPIGGTDPGATNIKAANNAQLAGVIKLGDGTAPSGHATSVRDLVVDGNKANAGTSTNGAGILVHGQRVEIHNVAALNSAGDGIAFEASPTAGACCARVSKVITLDNGRDGIRLHSVCATCNTANDVIISESEMGGNVRGGVTLEGAAAARITTSDISGNGTGILSLWSSGHIVLSNTQFADQIGHDIQLAGGGPHTITGNTFIGSCCRAQNTSAMQIWDSIGTAVTGNTISMKSGTGTPLAYGIQFVYQQSFPHPRANFASGNVITCAVAGAVPISNASNSTGGLTPAQLNLTTYFNPSTGMCG